MPVYELNATVTLTLAGDSGDAVALLVTAPDGTETTPTPTFAGSTWSATAGSDQYGQWLYAWTVDGVAVQSGSYDIGGPWYVTLASLKRTVNRLPNDTSADDLFAPALEAASRAVEEYCDNRPVGGFLLADTASARLFRFDRWTIFDRDYCVWRVPVDDIGSLDDLVVETSDDGTTWTATTGYETWPLNALSRSKPITHLVFTEFGARLRVTARWGWPSVPSAVVEATRIQARRLYSRKNTPEGVMGASDWGLMRVPNLDPDVRALLAHLRTEALIA